MKPRALTQTLAPLAAVAAATVLALPSAQAALVTLDFDGVIETDITNDFAGLRFRSADPTHGPVRTWAATPALAHSGSNVLGLASTLALSQTDFTAIDIVFDAAVSFVSIQASFLVINGLGSGSSGLPFMWAYRSEDFNEATRLGGDTWNLPGDSCLTGTFCQSGYDPLRWASPAGGIKGIRISGSAAALGDVPRRAVFDTLSFDEQYDTAYGIGNGGGGGTVPVPGSVALVALALGWLGATGRARRRSTAPADNRHPADAAPARTTALPP